MGAPQDIVALLIKAAQQGGGQGAGTPTVPVNNAPNPNAGNIIQQVLQSAGSMSSLPQGVPPVINRTQLPTPNLSPTIRPQLDLGGSGQEFRTKGGRQRAGMERLFGNAARMIDAASQNREQKQLKALSMDIQRIYQAIAALDANPNDQNAKDTLNILLDPAQNKNFKKLEEVFDINFLQDQRDPKLVKAEQMARQRMQQQGGAAQNPMEIPAGIGPTGFLMPGIPPRPGQGAIPPQGGQGQPTGAPQPSTQGQPSGAVQPGQGGNISGLNPTAQRFVNMFPKQQAINPIAQQLSQMDLAGLKTIIPLLSQVMRTQGQMSVEQMREDAAKARTEFTQYNANLRNLNTNMTRKYSTDKMFDARIQAVNAELAKASAIRDMNGVRQYLNVIRQGQTAITQQMNNLVAQYRALPRDSSGKIMDDKKAQDLMKQIKDANDTLIEYKNSYKQAIPMMGRMISGEQKDGGSGTKPGPGIGITSPEDILNSIPLAINPGQDEDIEE